jgi:hypothetical protein
VARRGIGMDEYRALFDAPIRSQAKTLVIVMVPLFALLLLVAHAGRRRYFVEHLVFATHFTAFFILTIPVIYVLVLALGRVGLAAGIRPAVLDPLLDFWPLVCWCALYLYGGLRRAYGDGRAAALLRAAALGWGLMLVITAYRAVLFFTAFYAV